MCDLAQTFVREGRFCLSADDVSSNNYNCQLTGAEFFPLVDLPIMPILPLAPILLFLGAGVGVRGSQSNDDLPLVLLLPLLPLPLPPLLLLPVTILEGAVVAFVIVGAMETDGAGVLLLLLLLPILPLLAVDFPIPLPLLFPVTIIMDGAAVALAMVGAIEVEGAIVLLLLFPMLLLPMVDLPMPLLPLFPGVIVGCNEGSTVVLTIDGAAEDEGASVGANVVGAAELFFIIMPIFN